MKIINTKKSREFVKQLTNDLVREKEVKITGLGIFKVKATKKRRGINPSTGEKITIPAGRKIAFRVSSSLKKGVLGK